MDGMKLHKAGEKAITKKMAFQERDANLVREINRDWNQLRKPYYKDNFWNKGQPIHRAVLNFCLERHSLVATPIYIA